MFDEHKFAVCLSKMADSLAARREARRKRILENSQNRLQFISGKITDESPKGSPIKNYHLEGNHENFVPPLVDFTARSSSNNGFLTNDPEPIRFPTTHSDFVAAGDGEIDDLASLLVPSTTQSDNSKNETRPLWESLITYKYDVVILSLIVQLLFNVHVLNYGSTYIFLPLIVYTVTKVIWLPTENASNLTNVLLLLNGVSAGQAQWILGVMKYIGAISQDVCVYLFTMICVQSLCAAVIDILITQ